MSDWWIERTANATQFAANSCVMEIEPLPFALVRHDVLELVRDFDPLLNALVSARTILLDNEQKTS